MKSNRSENTFNTLLFANCQVLVVGGTSGIGAAIASSFVQSGATVTVTGGTQSELAASRTDSALKGVNFSLLDVRNDKAVQTCIGALPSLDVLVNCAGVLRRGQEMDPAVFAEVVDINLNGTLRCCVAAQEKLKETQGCIINTASMLSFFGGGLVPAYSASKGGVAQLTKSLAIALAGDGIRVNALAPGWIATSMTNALQQDEARSQAILSRTPLKRWGTPQDVASVALFLASPAASFVTGVILPVDGGYLIT